MEEVEVGIEIAGTRAGGSRSDILQVSSLGRHWSYQGCSVVSGSGSTK